MTKGAELFEQLSECQLLEKDFAMLGAFYFCYFYFIKFSGLF